MPTFLERIKARKFSTAASTAVDIGVDGEAQARLAVDAGGKLIWGGGSAAGDVTLYRSDANTLKTDDTFTALSLIVDNIEIDTTGASLNDVLTYDGTKFAAASVAAGGANVTSSATAPSSPNAGDLWIDSVSLDLYTYYDSHWVQLTGEEPVVEDLNDLADVDTTSLVPGQFLKWNGTTWVPDTIAGGATVSDSTPNNSISGQLWYKSDTGGFYIYYSGTWVEVGASPATFPTGKSIAMSIVFGG